MLSDTRHGAGFVTGIGFCILCYQTRDRGYDLLRALGSASCVIRHETEDRICYGHWVLHLVLSDTRQVLRFVAGIGFCILCYQTRNRGYDLLRALGSASCVIRHKTGLTIRYGHWVLHLVLSGTRQGGTICYRPWVLHLVLSDARQGFTICCGIGYETMATICYGHWVLHLVLSDTRHGVRFVTALGFCILCYQTRNRGVRFVTGIGFCILCFQTGDRGYDLLRALGSASCDIRHQTGGTICYRAWVLHLVLSDNRQGVGFVTGIGFCILCYQTRNRGYDLLRALGSAS